MRPRPELLRGLAVLGVFIVLVLATDLLLPHSVAHSEYTVIDIERAEMNPLSLEGLSVSSRATVVTVEDMGTHYLVEIEAATVLVFPSTVGHPEPGDTILFRGTCWIHSNGSIVVREFYVLDGYSSLFRSIPGILVFVVLFIVTFTVGSVRRHVSSMPLLEPVPNG